jgi:hypothetical protein
MPDLTGLGSVARALKSAEIGLRRVGSMAKVASPPEVNE